MRKKMETNGKHERSVCHAETGNHPTACGSDLVSSGSSANALGNPLRVVAWLANKLAEYGECLEAGEIVITGSLNPAVYINAGDRFVADFGPLGKIQANFI